MKMSTVYILFRVSKGETVILQGLNAWLGMYEYEQWLPTADWVPDTAGSFFVNYFH